MAIFGKASTEKGSDNMSAHIVVKGRWCLTEDGKRVVPEGHPEGRWLWAIHGQAMPEEECKRLGYGEKPKQLKPQANKQFRPRSSNK